ncbi:DUF3649 domain-containing protein [Acidovorax sp. NCPPB 3576]|uniref:DUF3649 domain-containing protein n=1 Tax=Acidovorax sp. NCPPB 3576 TaxID=2940488 RepID=UPI00234ADC39|nr:DUF3649 domain-containing protein [Acidovorax sp. NCPPB 3576]WCM90697.1 DUF3649 domain-containing protein [Acidovorax sp. NCPPB 3576]
MSRQPHPSMRWPARLGVASRVLAACAGGYVLASLLAAVLALAAPRLWGWSRADGVLLATLLSFAVYAVIALWVFCARSALRAWLGLGAVAVPCLALLGWWR